MHSHRFVHDLLIELLEGKGFASIARNGDENLHVLVAHRQEVRSQVRRHGGNDENDSNDSDTNSHRPNPGPLAVCEGQVYMEIIVVGRGYSSYMIVRKWDRGGFFFNHPVTTERRF